MISYLSIRDFVLVERLDLEFEPGFIVLTGETGAGKSVITEALQLILGGRARSEDVRKGAERMVLQATFQIAPQSTLRKALQERDIDLEEEQLIIRREITPEGKSRAFVNGVQTPLATLKELGALLADFHGQHDHESLLRPSAHRALLDDYASHELLLQNFKEAFDAHQQKKSALETLTAREARLKEERDLLEHRLKELTAATLSLGHEEALIARIRLLESGQKMTELLSESREALDGEALPALKRIEKTLRKLAEMNPSYEAGRGQIAEALALTEQTAKTLPGWNEEAEEESLDALNESLAKIAKLKRKHQRDEAGLLELQQETEAALAFLSSSATEKHDLEQECERLSLTAKTHAEALSRSREKAARKFEKAIIATLRELNMDAARFTVELQKSELPGPTGIDQVEFLFSANPGEPPRPMARIASGGELARVMLSIRAAIAERDRVPVLVFDEVDTGIGGETAEKVGAVLHTLGKTRQVFCVTHAHQIAKNGDAHYSVEKRVRDGRTLIRVHPLDQEARVEELARMLGGAKNRSAVSHATHLLKETRHS